VEGDEDDEWEDQAGAPEESKELEGEQAGDDLEWGRSKSSKLQNSSKDW
jgi:hypothetical protein